MQTQCLHVAGGCSAAGTGALLGSMPAGHAEVHKVCQAADIIGGHIPERLQASPEAALAGCSVWDILPLQELSA